MEILVLAVFALGIGGALGWFDSSDDDNPGPGGGDPDDPVDPPIDTTGDLIIGDSDGDTHLGTSLDDTIFANGGDDTVHGLAGDDRIFLRDGNDGTVPAASAPYFGQGGDDFIRGGNGADEIYDALGANTVHGDTGADIIATLDLYASSTAADEADTLFGGYGSDILVGDEGDTMTGGAQEDVFVVLVHPNSDDNEPVQITDFGETEDAGISIVVSNTTDVSAVDDLSNVVDASTRITQDLTTDGVMISLDGEEVAFVQGATAEVSAAKIALVEALTATAAA